MGTKCPMSLSSSCLIKPHNSHCPFALSCNITYTFPMQTMHHPPVPPPILTNHTPPTTSLYWPPNLHWNVGTLHFLKFPWSCTCRTFSLVHFTTPPIAHFLDMFIWLPFTLKEMLLILTIFLWTRLYACGFLMCLLFNCHHISSRWSLKEVVKLWSMVFGPLWMFIMIRWCFM